VPRFGDLKRLEKLATKVMAALRRNGLIVGTSLAKAPGFEAREALRGQAACLSSMVRREACASSAGRGER